MKFIHMSDLHIGKIVNSYSMLAEQRRAFEQVSGYIETEKPDAVIIAGDIYDRAVPSVEAVRLFDDFLTSLARGNVTVLLISGNHDSPERINFANRLLSEKKIFLCGSFNGSLQKIVLSDDYGDVNFWLLPFIKPLAVRGFFSEQEIETYDEALAAVLKTADIDYNSRNVLVSHQFYSKTGVTPIRCESELNPIGGLDAVDCGLIEKFDYAALGHLHGAQNAGAAHIRYAGSPVKYSFSEWRHEKSVSLVTLNEKGGAEIKELFLTPIHDMREIKGKIDKLMSREVISLADKNDYLRVILTDEEEIIDPIGKLRSVYPNLMNLDFDNSRKSTAKAVCIDTGAIETDGDKTKKLSPFDLFTEFFLDTHGSVMTEEQIKIVQELLESEAEL